jgi:hypothetical protein
LACVDDQSRIIAMLSGKPTPTAGPSNTATGGPTGSPTVQPSTTTSSPPGAPTPKPTVNVPVPSGVCPAWPGTPDANCTGYKHTGVTLKDCPTSITKPGTYDSCRFQGGLTIASSGVTVKRSLVNSGHIGGSGGDEYDLKGVILEDVQIVGPGNDGSAAIGNSNYTCRRCDVSNNNRGFAVANNVVILDSYAHDFWVQPSALQNSNSAHQTAISTHGGHGVQIVHSTFRCNSDSYACSSAFSFYSEDSPGISDVLVQNCRISSDAGYGLMFGTMMAGKPYGITNTRIVDNVISSDEYGPVANWPQGQAGNVWTGNKEPNGSLIKP